MTRMRTSGPLPEIVLLSETPDRWVERCLSDLPALVADHAACELQAAVFALSLVGLYPDRPALVDRLSALAAEELRHFRKATREARRLGARLLPRRRNRYAATLRKACRNAPEPERGLDLLLVAALIEARSHERFLKLAPRLGDARLARLYAELAEAEARHGPAYVELAVAHAGAEAALSRLAELSRVESSALEGDDGGGVSVHAAV